MSIRATANYSQLFIINTGRELAVPPLVFPGFTTDASQHFSYSIWVRLNSKIPTAVTMHHSAEGSYMKLGTDGFVWQLESRDHSVGVPTLTIGNVLYGRWTLLCVSKNGPQVTVYMGVEDSLDLNPWERPVEINLTTQVNYNIIDPFGYFSIIVSNNADICNFKFWNHTLTKTEFQTQANTWVPTGSPAPIWASPLRTMGDISNIANPSSTINWTAEHGYSQIDAKQNIVTGGSLGAWNDPAYLAFSQPCPTWVYPFNFPLSTGLGHVFIDPGLTPLAPTIYKAPQFFSFADAGTIPHVDGAIQSIVHYATVFNNPAEGVVPESSFGLYKDENGVEISPNFTDPANRFEQDSGVTIPGPITATNMYLWKFGGQFRWLPATPQVEAATGALIHQFLYVTYIGFPTGLLLLSDADLSGIFISNTKLPKADTYHGTTSLKIPNPTIRTALIGE